LALLIFNKNDWFVTILALERAFVRTQQPLADREAAASNK